MSGACHRRQVGRRLVDVERGGDEIPGDAPFEKAGVPHLERHGHRRHEAGDVPMPDDELLTGRMHPHDLPLELVLPTPRASKRDAHDADEDREKTTHSLTLARASQGVKWPLRHRFGCPERGMQSAILRAE